MDNNQLKELKVKVDDEILKTSQNISDYKEMTKPEALDCAVGRVSRMDAINNKSVMKAALRQAEQKLIKLKYVLTQIDNEKFGLCARCGKEIPIGRILLMPESVHCVNCAR